MPVYEVVVSHIGRVYYGRSELEARGVFSTYIQYSKEDYGHIAGESISLWKDYTPVQEYLGTRDTNQYETEEEHI